MVTAANRKLFVAGVAMHDLSYSNCKTFLYIHELKSVFRTFGRMAEPEIIISQIALEYWACIGHLVRRASKLSKFRRNLKACPPHPD